MLTKSCSMLSCLLGRRAFSLSLRQFAQFYVLGPIDVVFEWHKIDICKMTSESITLSSELSKSPVETKLTAHVSQRQPTNFNVPEFRELETSIKDDCRGDGDIDQMWRKKGTEG